MNGKGDRGPWCCFMVGMDVPVRVLRGWLRDDGVVAFHSIWRLSHISTQEVLDFILFHAERQRLHSFKKVFVEYPGHFLANPWRVGVGWVSG